MLTGQLSVGWSNDVIDLDRDLAADRRDKPLVTGALPARAVAAAAGCALALCVPLSLASGWRAGMAHLTGVAAAWAYNLGVKRTALSWLPYALGFALLPAFVTLGLPGHPWPPPWLTAAGALLGVGAHFTNVLPDIDADLAAGIRHLPSDSADNAPARQRLSPCWRPPSHSSSGRPVRPVPPGGPVSPAPEPWPWPPPSPSEPTPAAASPSCARSAWPPSTSPCSCCAATASPDSPGMDGQLPVLTKSGAGRP